MQRILLACVVLAVLGIAMIEDYYMSPSQRTVQGTEASSSTSATLSSVVNPLVNFGSRAPRLPVGPGPYGMAYDPAAHRTFVAVSGANSVAVVDDQGRVVGEVPIGAAADFVAFDQANSFLYASLVGENSIVLVNMTTFAVAASVSVSTGAGWMTYDPASQSVYAVNREANTVSVISGTAVVKTIALSGLPFAAAFDPADGDVYVTNNAGAVFVIDGTSASVVATVQVGEPTSNLLGIAYNPSDRMMYVTSNSDDEVFILNGTKPAGSIAGFSGPTGIAFSASAPEMFVVNSGNGTLTATWSGASSTVKVGSNPREALFNPQMSAVLVTNYGNSTVSLVGA